MTIRITARLVARRESGWNTTPLVEKVNDTVGRLQIAVVQQPLLRIGGAIAVHATTPQYFYGAPAAAPLLLRGVHIENRSGFTSTVRLAVMSVLDGAPGSQHACLLWDWPVLHNEGYHWTGQLPLVGRYLYASVDQGTSCNMLLELQRLTP